MLNTTNQFADTTEIDCLSSVIDDTLKSLRISGSLLLRETYATPWAIAVPNADQLAALLGVTGTRVVAFHLVEFGLCEITPEGEDSVLLTAGEMAITFGGEAHQLSQGKPSQIQPIETLLSGEQNVQHPEVSGRAAGTSLLCGVFLLHDTALNPLFLALPPLLHVTLSKTGELHNLAGVARLMADEVDRKSLGGGYIVERLLEVLCAEAVRAHIEAVPRQDTSWFRGIKDQVVGRAIVDIHQSPGKDWSVQRLAQEVAMSPSRFAARFSEALGDSPMAYVAKWRMNVACRQLSMTRQSVDQIAADVGYESPAAFSRAFKKLVGMSPAKWRAQENL